MSVRAMIVIGAAVMCGISAVAGVLQMRAPTTSQALAEEDVTEVIVAREAIARGRLLTEELVRSEPWPPHLLPEGAITDFSEIRDRVVLIALAPGEAILESKLASKEAGFFDALVPMGYRAYPIQAAGVMSNVAGFVRPGNRVDVLLHLRSQAQDDSGGGSSTTLLQAVEILAAGKMWEDGDRHVIDSADVGSVTLIVTPEQVILLDLGQRLGDLSLSLRNSDDMEQSADFRKTAHDIKFRRQELESMLAPMDPTDVRPVSIDREPPKVSYIRTLRGRQWGEVEVEAVR